MYYHDNNGWVNTQKFLAFLSQNLILSHFWARWTSVISQINSNKTSDVEFDFFFETVMSKNTAIEFHSIVFWSSPYIYEAHITFMNKTFLISEVYEFLCN